MGGRYYRKRRKMTKTEQRIDTIGKILAVLFAIFVFFAVIIYQIIKINFF
jgi:hypothetical protein